MSDWCVIGVTWVGIRQEIDRHYRGVVLGLHRHKHCVCVNGRYIGIMLHLNYINVT